MASVVSSEICDTLLHGASKGTRRFLRTALYVLSWTDGATLFDVQKLCSDGRVLMYAIGAVWTPDDTDMRDEIYHEVMNTSVGDYRRACVGIKCLYDDDDTRHMFGHERKSVDISSLMSSGASIIVKSNRTSEESLREPLSGRDPFRHSFAASCVINEIMAAARHRSMYDRNERVITPLFVNDAEFALPDDGIRWMMDEMREYGVPVAAGIAYLSQLSDNQRDEMESFGRIIAGSCNDDDKKAICGTTHGSTRIADFDDDYGSLLMIDGDGKHATLHKSDNNEFGAFAGHRDDDGAADAVMAESRKRFMVSNESIDDEISTHDARVFGCDE